MPDRIGGNGRVECGVWSAEWGERPSLHQSNRRMDKWGTAVLSAEWGETAVASDILEEGDASEDASASLYRI
ncbi:MAG: hypothetical protein IPF56_23620 [Chloroflexi bacterium]|nr:hypothetical protein [Chloroflexota bacterium]